VQSETAAPEMSQMGSVSDPSDKSRLLSLFLCSVCIITLVALGALDAELGDQHSAVEKRRRMGLSIYVSSLDWERDSSVLVEICVLAMTAGLYFIVRARGVGRVVGALCSLLTVQALLLFPSSVREMSDMPALGTGVVVLQLWKYGPLLLVAEQAS